MQKYFLSLALLFSVNVKSTDFCVDKQTCDVPCHELKQECAKATDCQMTCPESCDTWRSKGTEEKSVKQIDDEKTKEILMNFAGVVKDFGKMVLDPKNKECISQNLCKMLEGMVNIVMTMTRNRSMNHEEVCRMVQNMDSKLMQCMEQIAADEATNIKRCCTEVKN